jgi:isoprenylcysteine carboxyl methyltransferase (ICMT) family protein YpbQ
MKTQPPLALPRSAVPQALAFCSLALACGVIAVFRQWGSRDAIACLAALIVAVALPHILADMPRIVSRVRSGNAVSLRRVGLKCLGLAALFSVMFLAYQVFRGFTREFLQPILSVPVAWLAVLAAAAPFYIALTDRVMEEPEDGLYRLGCNVMGTTAIESDESLRQFLLGWLVKGFFAPLMIVFASNGLQGVLTQDYATALAAPAGWYDVTYNGLYFIDVVFAAAGYLCTFKLFDAHIRSTEPTMFGWVVCIACYPPFWNAFSVHFFTYESSTVWGSWLADSPVLYGVWGSVILACVAFYAWATVTFGMRFSNLTHRGILTNGPYRLMMHPAYVSKNLSWWLISVPFIVSVSVWESLLNCLALLMVNGIYTLRAITEERHLSRDPDYLAYAAWMKEHGVMARIRRRFPALARSARPS